MSTRSPQRSKASVTPRWRALGWVAVMAGVVGLVVWDAAQQVRHYARGSAAYGVAVRAPAVDPASPTGFAHGVRTMIYPGRWVDAQQWIMQTQQMLAKGEWRLRQVDYDNAPAGREMHWGSLFRWWLGTFAWADHALTGEPLGSAAERSALLANPVLLALLMLWLVPWVARRLGGGAAAFFAVGMVAALPFAGLFAADNMDHHGIIQATTMGVLIGVLVGGSGWVRNEAMPVPSQWAWLPTQASARRVFVIAGVSGGLGMWVSAAGTIPVLVGVGLGALASGWVGRKAPGFVRFDADLWRRWGMAGGLTSAACYLVEYFPSHLGWRMEVNHPLYAVAWIGGGEVLAGLTARLSRSAPEGVRFGRWRIAAGLVAVVLPLVALRVGGERVFAAADPFLWALGRDYTPEGQSFLSALERSGWNANTIATCLPMLLMPMVAVWLGWRRTPALARAVVAVPFASAALFWLATTKQLRWWTVGYGPLLALGAVLVAMLVRAQLQRGQRMACWGLGLALFAPGLILAVQAAATPRGLAADDLYSLVERDLAHTLTQRTGGNGWVVLGGPATTARMIYFGGARGLGTPYWENLDGLKRAAAIFAAKSEEEARALITAAGVTHLVLVSWDNFVEPYVRLARGLTPEQRIEDWAFGIELGRTPEPPAWLRRLPDHLPKLPLFERDGVLIFEVTDRTQPEQVAVRAVRDRLYHGQLSAAQEVAPRLERHADDLAAQVALARLRFAAGDTAGAGATLDRVGELLPQRVNLEPEDRVDMVAILMLGNRMADARRELSTALREFDAAALRQLSPGALKTLIGIARRLGVPWPDPALEVLAAELVPPDGRI